MRLTPALWTLVAAIFAANWTGWGHNYLGILLLAGFFHLARALPEREWRWLVGTLLAVSVLIASLAIVQMWHMDRARGPFLSPNLLGFYAVVMMFLAAGSAETRASYTSYLSAACNLISLALSQSRASILALAAGLFVMFWRRPLVAFLGVIAAIWAAAAIRPDTTQGRMDIWRAGWQVFLHRPLTGWGEGGVWVGGLKAFYSIPLDLMVAAGILGLLAGAWLFIEGVIAARRQPALQAMLVAWLVNGLFIYGTPATFVPIFLVLGRLSRQQEERHPTRYAQRRRDGADEAEALRLDAPA